MSTTAGAVTRMHRLLERIYGWHAPTEEIRAKLVEHRYASTRPAVLFANLVVAAAVAINLSDRQPAGVLLGWLSAIGLVMLSIMWGMAHYARHRAEHASGVWAFRFTLGGLLNGLAWGMGSLLFYDPATPAHNILLVGITCGMTAGQVVTSFAIPGSTYAFLIPSILLSMLMPFLFGNPGEQTLAFLWFPYLVIMIILTRSAHRGLADSIRLSYENAHLAERLAAAKERAERLARAKSDFLAIMSHEIRTPMHGMLGIAELLSNSNLDTQQKLYLEHLRGAGEYLAQLLNNILDFSKIEAEKLVLHETEFSLADLVGEVTRLFAIQAARKGVALDIRFPEGLPLYVRGDPHRLKQVLINLLGNAFKFTEFGSVRLDVGVTGAHGGRTQVRFRVVDTGPGISPELIPTLFDPFTQANMAESHHYGGTGLGLAISKRLVQAMGGQMTLESRVGEGSTFAFTIPFVPCREPLPARPAPAGDAAPLPAVRVLLADDAALNRLVVREFLGRAPCVVDEAEDGAEALQKFQAGHYEVVLMDLRMPVMDGLESVRRIRLWEKEQQRQPALIIMLTASAFDSDRLEVMAAGCNALLQKPVQKAGLLQLLRQHMEAASVPAAAGGQTAFTSATPTEV